MKSVEEFRKSIKNIQENDIALIDSIIPDIISEIEQQIEEHFKNKPDITKMNISIKLEQIMLLYALDEVSFSCSFSSKRFRKEILPEIMYKLKHELYKAGFTIVTDAEIKSVGKESKEPIYGHYLSFKIAAYKMPEKDVLKLLFFNTYENLIAVFLLVTLAVTIFFAIVFFLTIEFIIAIKLLIAIIFLIIECCYISKCLNIEKKYKKN